MWPRRRHAAMVGVAVGLFSISAALGQTAPDAGGEPPRAQGQGGYRGQMAGMGRVMGEVSAVDGTTLTVKTEDNGSVQVVTTDNTRVMKDRGPAKITDLHPGDGLMAVGNMDAPNKTLHAAMVFAEDAAQVKAMRENLGKTYISGRVTAVDLDNAKMTVERADHVSQTIGFDETTSFKRAIRGGSGNAGPGGSGAGGSGSGGDGSGGGGTAGSGRGSGGGFGGGGMGLGAAMGAGIDRAFNNGESITLADIKVGDMIAGTGSVKNGVFVPTRVVDSPPRQRRAGTGGQQGQPAGAGAPASAGQSTGSGPGER